MKFTFNLEVKGMKAECCYIHLHTEDCKNAEPRSCSPFTTGGEWVSKVDLYHRSETLISDEPERLEESLDAC